MTPRTRRTARTTSRSGSTSPSCCVTASPPSPAPGAPPCSATAPRPRPETYLAQLGLLARKPPQEQIRKALATVVGAGTLPVTALAQRVGLPPTRGDGFAAVLRQLLNYDGVQVLETLPDGRTLRLHTALLRDQFELR